MAYSGMSITTGPKWLSTAKRCSSRAQQNVVNDMKFAHMQKAGQSLEALPLFIPEITLHHICRITAMSRSKWTWPGNDGLRPTWVMSFTWPKPRIPDLLHVVKRIRRPTDCPTNVIKTASALRITRCDENQQKMKNGGEVANWGSYDAQNSEQHCQPPRNFHHDGS